MARIVLEYDGSSLTDAKGVLIVWAGLIGFNEEIPDFTKKDTLDSAVFTTLAEDYTIDEILQLREKGLI